jgi:branched-chain amino acid transport system substrate-binding protein
LVRRARIFINQGNLKKGGKMSKHVLTWTTLLLNKEALGKEGKMKKNVLTWTVALLAIFFLMGNLGSGANVAASDKEPVKIGVLLPLTGGAAAGGKKELIGIELAQEEINQLGGVLDGRPIKLIVEDTESRPEAGMDGVHKLVDVEKVSVILGAHSSAVSIPTGTYSNKKGVVQIAVSSTAPSLREIGPYLFTCIATDEVMASDLVKFASQDSGQKDFAMLVMNDSFGVGMAKEMRKAIEAGGGKVLAEVRYEKGKSDYRAELQRLFEPKPKAILSVAWFQTSRIIQKQAYELGMYQSVKDTWYSPYINIAVASCLPQTIEGRKGTRTVIGTGPRVEAFHNKYKKKIGDESKQAEMYTCLGYDAMWVTALAIKMAESTEAVKIRDMLTTVFGLYRGMSGEDLSVDDDGIRMDMKYARQVYRNGTLVDY